MPDVASAGVSLLVPAGSAVDPANLEGAATLLVEMMQKGAGAYDNRGLSEEFEKIGVHYRGNAGVEVSIFSASMIAEHLPRALELFAAILLEPHLPDGELDSVRALALQDIEALEDEPSSKVMNELAKQFYPHPFGRSQMGTKAGVEAVKPKDIHAFFKDVFQSGRLIIGVAGKFDWEVIKSKAQSLFGKWRGANPPLTVPEFSKKSVTSHLQEDTHQIQIALAYPSVSFGHPDYYAARVGTGVLSGGMAGRLFIEVREKRGLVYRVGASHSAARGRGAMFAFAGTTPDHAEETLSVMAHELRNLAAGVTEEELNRAKVDLKAALIMQSESSSVRANALVNDWWNLNRLRELSEIRSAIEAVTNEDIRRHLAEYPVSPVTLVTLGPKELELPK